MMAKTAGGTWDGPTLTNTNGSVSTDKNKAPALCHMGATLVHGRLSCRARPKMTITWLAERAR